MTELLADMIEFDNVADFSGARTRSYDRFDDALARANAMMRKHSTGRELKMFVGPGYGCGAHAAPHRRRSGSPAASVKGSSGASDRKEQRRRTSL